jgi:predicted DNA-binding transcriptional regulator AlpA
MTWTGRSRSSIDKAMKKGTFPQAIKVGKSILWSFRESELWIEEQKNSR